MHLVLFGDRRKARDLSILADEIVLVQPMHTHDDRPVLLVVEVLIEGESNHSFAACRWACDSASLGFSGPLMMMMSAPSRSAPGD